MRANTTIVVEPKRLSLSLGREVSGLFHFTAASLFYLGTALVGVWGAYDRGVAWERFVPLTLAVVLAVSLLRAGVDEEMLAFLGTGCAVSAGAIGVYYLLTHDWRASSAEGFIAFPAIGHWLQSHRPALIPLPPIHEIGRAHV